MKIIFSFLLITVFSTVVLFSQLPFNGLGDGSETNPYQIWNNAHLKELHDSMLNTFWPNYSTWHIGKHFRLMQDITTPLTHPISPTNFQGIFRGGGHKIIVKITAASFPPEPFKLARVFGSLGTNGIIDSLTVDGYLTGPMAGIVGGNSGTISYVVNNATLTALFGSTAGGIAVSNGGLISNCVFNDSIVSEGVLSDMMGIGGIVGVNEQGGAGGQIINCINNGKIIASILGGSVSSGVGGIAGVRYNAGSVVLSGNINNGVVEGQNNVGGIIGRVTGVPVASIPVFVTDNVNNGFVKGSTAVGGIIGSSGHFDAAGFYNVNIFNNFNSGVVMGVSETGCIVGRNNGGTISNNHYDKQMCGE